MNFLFDTFPIIIFFIVYKLVNIFWATGILIIASAIQIGYMWIRKGKVDFMYILTFALVLFFGGATIILHDARFLQWKVSLVNWLFGALFLLSPIVSKKPFIQHMMGKSVELPKKVWIKLNWMWAIFFIAMGCINSIVVELCSLNTWVDFKVFGLLGLTLVFVVIQSFYLYKYIKDEEK